MTTSKSVPTSFSKVLRHLGDAFGRDITMRQMELLVVVADAGSHGIGMTELADATESSLPFVSRQAAQFGSEKYNHRGEGEMRDGLGWFRIEIDTARDNRKRIVFATEELLNVIREAQRLASAR